ncbi:hypothetical protein NIES2135_53910 [Leptolyngbya boryana NIES-2135]|jgi:hypothetical protein|uniref:Uncharacterized protein n=1 Tax=Leptolyngbya boryana NIES-2135 TaxID=1973484 RepID=A0A1Z4JPE9_LEPBY|nr:MULTISPECIES: hypothetical protein [Leptolyngbya]BAY58518.1 hypothetical protein NIES2135_53910 [Leptolyngbya boryana NIES-2135]MBD2370993.1 hypothetical protein [Leptolyngbya sp. FACHB-161]MBD2377507.1 hypothetical protein [Leptolyngbya sp. FACHB-238]MBD2401916.1 hypothetical protein [Leptolyngbya sp. FACHB-239]MBD2408433.1 hypothetical protein [Leptolyngbya sp. FACHB-402]
MRTLSSIALTFHLLAPVNDAFQVIPPPIVEVAQSAIELTVEVQERKRQLDYLSDQ